MKFSLFALLVASTAGIVSAGSGGATAAAGCNHDNCLRGMLGVSSATASSDCSKYLRTTLTAYTSTVTTIVTPVIPGFMKRSDATATVLPSTYPAYATCSSTVVAQITAGGPRVTIAGVDRYSSACACIGVQATGTTTVQAVQTVSVTEFTLGLQCNGVDSYFIYVDTDNNNKLRAHDYYTFEVTPTVFTLGPDGRVLYNGNPVVTVNSDDPSLLFTDISEISGTDLFCNFQPEDIHGIFYLTQPCSSGTKKNFSIPGSGAGHWDLYLATADTSCFIYGVDVADAIPS
ncbi:hypothetical protein TWF694_003584 [Orbilia ellipsospora]|uniref:Uncharacterized protein n=1 Tax=Orbilia ellipsospora TaxID=2528407 RepID=A0AAV9WYN4_9PEZI